LGVPYAGKLQNYPMASMGGVDAVCMEQLPKEAFSDLKPCHLRKMPPASFVKFSSAQASEIPQAALKKGLTPEMIKNFPSFPLIFYDSNGQVITDKDKLEAEVLRFWKEHPCAALHGVELDGESAKAADSVCPKIGNSSPGSSFLPLLCIWIGALLNVLLSR
jgi:hypothetical protein